MDTMSVPAHKCELRTAAHPAGGASQSTANAGAAGFGPSSSDQASLASLLAQAAQLVARPDPKACS